MGRLALRAAWGRELQFVHVNETKGDAATAAHLLTFDSVRGPLAGILGYEERPLVSVDCKDDPRSAIVDALSTMVVDDARHRDAGCGPGVAERRIPVSPSRSDRLLGVLCRAVPRARGCDIGFGRPAPQ